MTLTTDQINEVRLLSGDDCEGDYISSDVQLNIWYSGLGQLACVVARAIQARMARATKTVDVRADGSPATNPQVAQIQSLLEYWQGQCTATLPTASLSELSLGIDEETDNFTNP